MLLFMLYVYKNVRTLVVVSEFNVSGSHSKFYPSWAMPKTSTGGFLKHMRE
jgi:hypothetical protein